MESEETGGTGQRGGGVCLGKCRPSALGATQGLFTRDAVSIGEAVLRVLERLATRTERVGARVVVCRVTFGATAHTRPLALSASQALMMQAPWNARMIAPRAVVYGRIASMGQDSPLPERIDSPPAFAIVALPHSNEGELKWLTTSELRTCPTQEPNRPWRLKCGNCFAPNMRRNTRLLSPNLRSTADALMPLSDNQTLFGDNFPDGVEFALGVVLFFASDESVDTLGDFNITIGEADATKGNVLFFKRTHVVFLSAVVMGVSFPQAALEGR